MKGPRLSNDPLYLLLRDEQIQDFNRRRAGAACDLRGLSFRGRDLRELDASGVDFGDAYFRDADLRGIDFRGANLEGASLGSAKVSGAYFPEALDAAEIRMSIEYGTRLRYRK
ncbi:MAG: pentapeptide repeat-containing protein [Polyangiaceae bacterium]